MDDFLPICRDDDAAIEKENRKRRRFRKSLAQRDERLVSNLLDEIMSQDDDDSGEEDGAVDMTDHPFTVMARRVADPYEQNELGFAPLIFVCAAWGHLDVIELFLKSGLIDRNLENCISSCGRSIFNLACFQANRPLIDMLVDFFIDDGDEDVDDKDTKEEKREKIQERKKRLLNAKDRTGCFPLFAFSTPLNEYGIGSHKSKSTNNNKKPQFEQFVEDFGDVLDLDQQTPVNDGMTSLMRLVKHRQLARADFLLKKGADAVTKKNHSGQTAFGMASGMMAIVMKGVLNIK